MATLTALLRELEPMIAPLDAYLARLEAQLTALLPELEPMIEVLSADARAHTYAQRYVETGTAIPYDDAVRLAFGLMAFRLPYTARHREPGGGISTVRDYEMLAVRSLQDGDLTAVIEESRSSPLAFRALEAALKHIRGREEAVPHELSEWAHDVADRTRVPPKARPGRSPHTNRVRDEVIVRTVGALVDAGLTATRNEVSEPKSACDAVAQALQAHGEALRYAAVAKIWSKRDEATERMDNLLVELGYAAKG